MLVVDDQLQARESMAFVLRQAGHQVDRCSSAAEAIQVIDRETFDCIITDLRMPGMNGVEFIIQLEQRRYGAAVVMVTAHASVSTAVEAMRHGAFDYIEKPFDAEQLEASSRRSDPSRTTGSPGTVRARRKITGSGAGNQSAGNDRLQSRHAGAASQDRPGGPDRARPY